MKTYSLTLKYNAYMRSSLFSIISFGNIFTQGWTPCRVPFAITHNSKLLHLVFISCARDLDNPRGTWIVNGVIKKNDDHCVNHLPVEHCWVNIAARWSLRLLLTDRPKPYLPGACVASKCSSNTIGYSIMLSLSSVSDQLKRIKTLNVWLTMTTSLRRHTREMRALAEARVDFWWSYESFARKPHRCELSSTKEKYKSTSKDSYKGGEKCGETKSTEPGAQDRYQDQRNRCPNLTISATFPRHPLVRKPSHIGS